MAMTWGCWMPRLLLPQTAENWTEPQRRLVLLHELAHIKRWDCATNLLTQLICALYWTKVLSPVFLAHSQPSRWAYWGPAKGTVALPAGKSVRLVVRNLTALNDLSPLAALAADDLTELSVSGDNNPRHAGDVILPHLRGLSGLKVLFLNLRDLTPKAMSCLSEMRSLQRLWIHTYPRSAKPEPGSSSRQLDDACLEMVAGLRSLDSLNLSSQEMTDQSLTNLTALAHLQELDLWSPKIQGPGLVSLEKLPALRRLRLGGLEISDNLLRPLAVLKSLRTLDLRYVKIAEAGGMAYLRQLDQLEDLTLWGTASSAQGLAHLQPLRNLKHLDLAMGGPNPVRPGDAAAVPLRELSSLERLRLVDFDFSDIGLAQLAQLTHLRSLELDSRMDLDPQTNRVYYSDSGLRALSPLRRLERLVVGSPRITDEGLASVAQFHRLKDLELSASGVSNDGLRHLAALASLESLSLGVPRVTISGLNHLNALTNLLRLQLRFIRQDNRGLNLSRLKKLEEFDLTMRHHLEAGRWPRVEEVRDGGRGVGVRHQGAAQPPPASRRERCRPETNA